ncbi:hypothetical protein [Haematobacter genomosp. 1]|uniref:Uncharacterized protein n=1 Tax=Haematobacter genomosp. 1 TaxID=366618 RepID=A0A212ACR1_9RHOB|nr:hypothetical protein [Haematobacter genomosp. 1]OWJ78764.1 hypothetical protein CDV49_06525 [Haematobacter genomosp. 1]
MEDMGASLSDDTPAGKVGMQGRPCRKRRDFVQGQVRLPYSSALRRKTGENQKKGRAKARPKSNREVKEQQKLPRLREIIYAPHAGVSRPGALRILQP